MLAVPITNLYYDLISHASDISFDKVTETHSEEVEEEV